MTPSHCNLLASWCRGCVNCKIRTASDVASVWPSDVAITQGLLCVCSRLIRVLFCQPGAEYRNVPWRLFKQGKASKLEKLPLVQKADLCTQNKRLLFMWTCCPQRTKQSLFKIKRWHIVNICKYVHTAEQQHWYFPSHFLFASPEFHDANYFQVNAWRSKLNEHLKY